MTSVPSSALTAARWPRLLVLALAVLLLHAALLAGLPAGLGGPEPGRPLALTVRQVVLTPVAPVRSAVDEAPAPAAATVPTARPRQAVPALPERPATADTPTSIAAPPRAEAEPAARPEAVPEPAPVPEAAAEPAAAASQAAGAETQLVVASAASAASAAPATSAPASAAASSTLPAGGLGDPPPTYATRLPPATTLLYELRRGRLSGQGRLLWQPAGPGYELTIEGTAFGLPFLTWTSQGGFDAAGLAPTRFVDRRRNREGRAANFQRERGVISFSATPAEVPLLPGAQDRLSWMVQLAAVVDAAPERYTAGRSVAMVVAGARGDVDVWSFGVVGREAVDVVGQRIEGALLLRRAPRKPYDTQVEVWLDPARHHLPVRVKLSSAGGDDSLEFVLQP